MKGHLSFCKHKPAGFLRKFGLTVFSILIVWTHTACFLFILTDTSTYFHHLGLFHLSGSKPLDSRSLSRKNWPVMLNPGLCQSQLERWPILIPKVQAFFCGFCQKIWVHPTVFLPPRGLSQVDQFLRMDCSEVGQPHSKTTNWWLGELRWRWWEKGVATLRKPNVGTF